MNEADEIAASIQLVRFASLEQARSKVRALMPDESAQLIDNVAESLHARVNRPLAHFQPCNCRECHTG